jgi:hypothetical protein
MKMSSSTYYLLDKYFIYFIMIMFVLHPWILIYMYLYSAWWCVDLGMKFRLLELWIEILLNYLTSFLVFRTDKSYLASIRLKAYG